MHGPINVKSPNNISKWQMGFNSAFKGLTYCSQYVSIISWKAEELLAFKKDCATLSQSASRNLLRAAETCGIPELSADGC
jgi:hypothetical protein